MKLLVFTTVLIGLVLAKPNADSSTRIINGNLGKGVAPYQAFLEIYISNYRYGHCGGSLLSRAWVITAAHCTAGASTIRTTLGAFSAFYPESSQLVLLSDIRYIYVHPNYNSQTLANDISLVLLPVSVIFNANIQPIGLPTPLVPTTTSLSTTSSTTTSTSTTTTSSTTTTTSTTTPSTTTTSTPITTTSSTTTTSTTTPSTTTSSTTTSSTTTSPTTTTSSTSTTTTTPSSTTTTTTPTGTTPDPTDTTPDLISTTPEITTTPESDTTDTEESTTWEPPTTLSIATLTSSTGTPLSTITTRLQSTATPVDPTTLPPDSTTPWDETTTLDPIDGTTTVLPELDEINQYDSYVGVLARSSGWGLTDGFGNQITEWLNYVDLEVLSNEDCRRYYGGSVADSNICTSGRRFNGNCVGDSGGPLVYNGTLIGVFSYVVQYCLPGYPSGFVRVTSHLPWINYYLQFN